MQATQAPLPGSLNLDKRQGKFRRVNESEWSTKLRQEKRGKEADIL